MSQSDAAQILEPYMFESEKLEIHEKDAQNNFKYETVYFFNVNERLKNEGSEELPGWANYGKINKATNNGFDDENK